MFAYRNVQRAVRDDRWKLIRFPQVDRTQLFDLQADPQELRNLADNPAQTTKNAELTALLEKLMQQNGDTALLKVPTPKPAEWSPPASGGKRARKGKGKAE